MKRMVFAVILLLISINIAGNDINVFRSDWIARFAAECLAGGTSTTVCACIAANFADELPGEKLREYDKRFEEGKATAADKERMSRIVAECLKRK